jgi:signal peptidase I
LVNHAHAAHRPRHAHFELKHGRHARRSVRHARTRPRDGSLVFDLSVFIPLAFAAALFVKTFVGQAFYVPSGSMAPILVGAPTGGDRVAVNKLSTWLGDTPQRGEVVVFRDELGWVDPGTPDGQAGVREGTRADVGGLLGEVRNALTFVGLAPAANENDLVKRVVGVGGDRVACMRGQLQVNGVPLQERGYIDPSGPACMGSFTIKVPAGRLFVLGDNRSNSADSSFHRSEPFDGTVSENAVIGPAFAVALPVDRSRGLPVPESFEQQVDSLTRFSTPASSQSGR